VNVAKPPVQKPAPASARSNPKAAVIDEEEDSMQMMSDDDMMAGDQNAPPTSFTNQNDSFASRQKAQNRQSLRN
jgi:hypothetical protein